MAKKEAAKTEEMHIKDAHFGKDRGDEKVEVTKKKGGRVKRKHGGHVPGKDVKPRLDRRARGGAVGSAKHPLSGADAPDMPYTSGGVGVGQKGKGDDRTKYTPGSKVG